MRKIYYIFFLVFYLLVKKIDCDVVTNTELTFDNELFRVITKDRIKENVIFSPASIQIALALGYFGAAGDTANEILKALRLDGLKKSDILKKYEIILEELSSPSISNNSMLIMANKLWTNENNNIKKSFQNVAKNSFHSEAVSIEFKGDGESEKLINKWVEERTNQKIRNLLTPGTLDESTSLVLVNALYFTGKWQMPFSTDRTRQIDFWRTPTHSVRINSMHAKHKMKYLASRELDAKILELPYADSDLSMVIILPNNLSGLEDLENKLKATDLLELTKSLAIKDVVISLPKFKIEQMLGLKSIFKQMGIRKMFEDDADFSGIFETNTGAKVYDIQHKAFVELNESGSEAAASTFLRVAGVSGISHINRFRADHPFVFFIKDSNFIYFLGHVAKL